MAKTNEERVRDLVINQLCVDDNEVVPEAKLMDDLGADSLDVVELVMLVEEEFELEVSYEDAENWNTVGDVYEYVNGKVK